MIEQNEHATYDKALEGLKAFHDQTADEVPVEEITDIGHFESKDQVLLELMIEKMKSGLQPLYDDPTVRAAVNGKVLVTLGQSVEEPGYDEKMDEEIVTKTERTLTPEQTEQLLIKLEARFNANKKRHKGIEWSKVQTRLNEAPPEKLWSLNEMERTGGEPDVVGFVEEIGEYEFWDFSKESPEGRRNVCYDREGQDDAERRGESPDGNAVDMAASMGLGGILNRDKYTNKLQKLGKFDTKTYSWIDTPKETREKGVALSARRNRGDVRVGEYSPSDHDDYMGFRGWLRV